MITYCKNCILPETKPDFEIYGDGICSACRNFSGRKDVDWNERKKMLFEIVDRYRSKDRANYDCIIPVSGGKDSTYQTLKILELGLNPLCITATTCALSDIGRRNIENLKCQGVDYIEVTTNPIVRKKLNKFTLITIGDISWAEHVSIFTIPVRVAVQTGVKLIIWGENPQNEFGGPATAADSSASLDRKWLEEFGGMLGLRVSDIIGQEGIDRKDMIQFTYPDDEDLKRAGVTGVCLGYFYPWDGMEHALVSQGHGFETFNKLVEGTLANYENVDNYQTGIHDYFKFLKFGFGRATDLASLHIRRGRLQRHEALNLVKKHDGKFPWTYLGRPIEDILADIDMTVDEFIEVCDRFTNKKIFKCDVKGNFIKDKKGNLTKVNYDNP